ncbi:MAG: protease modulator HflC [Gammaproteobacteria bacterium]|nr:MAG: protease modulator HflC [Gammaproteobacteria bacterium]
MSGRLSGILVGLLAVVFIGLQVVYVVPETHRAVKLRFGELVESGIQPGLHVRVPVMHEIKQFDVRVLAMDFPTKTYLTNEKKPLSVDAYATWQIVDVAKYYRTTTGDERKAMLLLESRIDNGLRDQFGKRTMHEVVAGQREELMVELTQSMDRIAQDEFGIKIIDIRVKAIDLPPKVSDSVYRRMESERHKEAQERRSKGEQLAEGIRADADRQARIIIAEATRDAEKIRGEGDAVAAQIYADAFSRDQEFYRFYRSLSAYEKAFSGKDDLLVLEPDSDFLSYLKDRDGK